MKFTTMKKKIIALILIIAIAGTNAGISTLANSIEVRASETKTKEVKDVETDNIEAAEIVKEIKSERTENSNTYLLSDGSKELEIANYDIRYKEKGKWVDYDTSIVDIEGDDTCNVELIENEESYQYKNAVGKYAHYFGNEVSEDVPVVLTNDNYEISFAPIKSDIESEGDDDSNNFIHYKEIDKENDSEIVYENEDTNEEYRYVSLTNGVKESIVLEKKPNDNVYVFDLNLKGLKPTLNNDTKEILLLDKQSDKTVAVVQAPNLIDANNIVNYDDVSYDILGNEDGSYTLSVVVDSDYLENANYPVTIDPTYVWVTASMLDYGLTESGSNSNVIIPLNPTFTMKHDSNKDTRAYFKFTNLNEQIRGKYIYHSYFGLNVSNTSGNITLGISAVKDWWGRNYLAWINQPEVSEPYCEVSNFQKEHQACFIITDWAKEIASGQIQDEYGLALTCTSGVSDGTVSFYSPYYANQYGYLYVYYKDATETDTVYDSSFQVSHEIENNKVKLSWDVYRNDVLEYDVFLRKNTNSDFNYIGRILESECDSNEKERVYEIPLSEIDTKADIRVMAIKSDDRNSYFSATNYLSNIISIGQKQQEGNSNTNADNNSTVEYEQIEQDTDGDELEDGYEIWDLKTYWNTETTDSTEENKLYNLDTDNDGFTDSYEVFSLGTDPTVANETNADSDGDGWTDLFEQRTTNYQGEAKYKTDPWLPDSDFDGTIDSGGDSNPILTNGSTDTSAATATNVHIGNYDRQYSENDGEVTISYVTNIYSGDVKQIAYDYGDVYLNKTIKYFYDERRNNTAIIEQYDSEYRGVLGAAQTICITYTYDDNNNVINICDEKTRYMMEYNPNGDLETLRVGSDKTNSYNIVEQYTWDSHNHADAESEQSTETIYGNGQKMRVVTATYENEENSGEEGDNENLENDSQSGSSTVKVEEIFYTKEIVTTNGHKVQAFLATPDYKLEYNADGDMVKLSDFTESTTEPVEYEFDKSDNKNTVTRNDGFKIETETSEEKNEDTNVTTTTTNKKYSFKHINDVNSSISSTITTDDSELKRATVNLFNGDTYVSLYQEGHENEEEGPTSDVSMTSIQSSIFNREVLNTTEIDEENGNKSYNISTYLDEDKNISYAYDKAGNITSISYDGSVAFEYSYDPHGRLVTEKDYLDGKYYKYSYNRTANIHSKNIWQLDENGNKIESTLRTVTLSYDEGTNCKWPDQLTSYDGQTITYDNSGNPTSYLNGMSFSWNNGRQLSNISFSDNTYASYKYNQDGLRTHKETSEYSVDYTWEDNQLVREQVTDKAINKTYDVWYLYDESGKAIGFQYYYKYYAGSSNESLGRATIYYEKDLQGNVIGLVGIDGQEFATYRYDAWGNVTASSCTQSGNLACQLNNITYRGYYRDRETGFYYLQSRYYDPETGRFINADDVDALGMETSSIFRDNLYVYCNSNPVKNVDINGRFAIVDDIVFWGSLAILLCAFAYIYVWNVREGNWSALGLKNWISDRTLVNIKNIPKYVFGKLIKFAKASKTSKKERSTDAPEWAKREPPKKGETGKVYAKRILDKKYGKGNWKKGPTSEFNRIIKYAKRNLKLK